MSCILKSDQQVVCNNFVSFNPIESVHKFPLVSLLARRLINGPHLHTQQ